MTSTNKDPILVVVQLTGGNDYINHELSADGLHKIVKRVTSILEERNA